MLGSMPVAAQVITLRVTDKYKKFLDTFSAVVEWCLVESDRSQVVS